MDCVTCEKCKVWGKLQILGLGTAIKILLTPEKEVKKSVNFLNRQEVIALVNTLHQLTTSVSFAANAAELELTAKLQDIQHKSVITICVILFLIIFFYIWRRSVLFKNEKLS
jgi:ERO1-like protein alpha